MKFINTVLARIPALLSSKVSIFIYLFLFFYLVVFALICLAVPGMSDMAPSGGAQLVLGNYTNVLSALGASVAAGSGVAIHSRIKNLRQSHEELQNSVNELHRKLDKLAGPDKAAKE